MHDLTDKELIDIGIEKIGHRKQLMRKLNEQKPVYQKMKDVGASALGAIASQAGFQAHYGLNRNFDYRDSSE